MSNTTNIRREIDYNGWKMNVTYDHKIHVTRGDEISTYDIPQPITKIEHDTDYVYLTLEDGSFYQCKFEQNDFFVGDIFTKDGTHIGEFACHVFGEN